MFMMMPEPLPLTSLPAIQPAIADPLNVRATYTAQTQGFLALALCYEAVLGAWWKSRDGLASAFSPSAVELTKCRWPALGCGP
jgi:hypothetical protein